MKAMACSIAGGSVRFIMRPGSSKIKLVFGVCKELSGWVRVPRHIVTG